MATGKVKWFNNAKGYGFILPEEGGEDLFAHYSSIEMDGYKTLKAGQDVEFEMLEGPKGYHAVNIRAFGDQGGDQGGDQEGDQEGNQGADQGEALPEADSQQSAEVEKSAETPAEHADGGVAEPAS